MLRSCGRDRADLRRVTIATYDSHVDIYVKGGFRLRRDVESVVRSLKGQGAERIYATIRTVEITDRDLV